MYYFLSLITGSLFAFMISANGTVGESAGSYASSVIIHFTGLIGILLILTIKQSKFKNLRSFPLWMYGAGFIGIITVLFSNTSYTALGVSLTTALGLLGQLITSILIDHFGWFGLPVVRFNAKKMIGFTIILGGIILMALPN